MSNSSSRDSQARKRNLPSWMSDRPDAETAAAAVAASAASSSSISDSNKQFSKLMKGVVFALSGFVNPERGSLRSQAIEMGAEYQPDWNSSCTLLVCAFSSTPKFRQVEADSGTIVSKEWISECYNQKKLVDIEPYLMNVGKPWRRQTGSIQANQDSPSSSGKSHTQVEKSPNPKPSTPLSKGVPENRSRGSFSPSKVKQWASDDFRRTITWLENQDEKPDESDVKKIAAEGIITCLQDTIDALKEGQNIKQKTEEWGCIPRAVEELIKLKTDTRPDVVSVCKQAKEFKLIYEMEYSKIDDDDMETTGKGKQQQQHRHSHRDEDKNTVAGDKTTTTPAEAYDSDETIEMTEEEIDQAFNLVSSNLVDSF